MIKTKTTKVKKTKQISSLDSLHSDFLNEFYNNNKTIDEATISLEKLKTKLDEYDKNTTKPNYLENRDIITSRIDKINEYINNLKHDEIDYYYKTFPILKEYYDMDNNTIISDTYEEPIIDEKDHDDNDFILSKWDNKNVKLATIRETQVKKKCTKPKKKTIFTILSGVDDCVKKVHGEKKITKNDLYNNYRDLLISDMKCIDNSMCPNCNEKYISYKSKGIRVCSNCNAIEKSKPEIDMTNYTDTRIKKPVMAYRTENHLKVWLTHIQGRETRVPPENVIEDTLNYLKKHNYSNESIKNVSSVKIKEVLKNLNYSKYYKNIAFISWKITDVQPPHLTKSEEEEILQMFILAEEPITHYYKSMCEKLNNPSYPCIIYKFLQFIEHRAITNNDYKNAERYRTLRKTLILLRSSKKLSDLDKCWKNICDHVGWGYVQYENT